jgi:hypothetical protein
LTPSPTSHEEESDGLCAGASRIIGSARADVSSMY